MTTKGMRRRRRSRADHQESSALVKQLAPTAMPPVPLPMLCTLVAEPFDNPAWIFEPKYDGLPYCYPKTALFEPRRGGGGREVASA